MTGPEFRAARKALGHSLRSLAAEMEVDRETLAAQERLRKVKQVYALALERLRDHDKVERLRAALAE